MRLANKLHVRTRDHTIRDHLLIRPGDAWSESRARECERTLRALGILEPYRIVGHRVGDSVDVVVQTRDDWTTRPEFALESASDQSFFTVSLVEQNLLGHGKAVSVSYRETPEGITRSAGYGDPNVLGSRLRLSVAGGNGTEGASQSVEVGVPFYAEDTPYSYGVHWSLVTSVARLFLAGEEGATFDRRIEESEIHWGRGWRRETSVARLSGSFLIRDQRFGASQLVPGAPPEFAGGEENLHVRRLAGKARLWCPRYEEWEGLDRLGGVEDVDLGPSAQLTLGFSPRALGGTADEGCVGAKLDGGFRSGAHSFAEAHLDVTSRLRPDPLDLVGRLKARWVSQLLPHHTLVLAAQGVGAYRPDRDFQEILGGLSGLRGSTVRALAGQEAWRFNAEHRWRLGHDFFELMSLGAVGFYDLGRTFGPGAVEPRWLQDAGVGLRVALPRSGQNRVARLDVAWPIAPQPGDDRGPVFSLGSGQAF
jgi:hypothetical protein